MSQIVLTVITPQEIALIYSGFAVVYVVLFVGLLRAHLKDAKRHHEELRSIRNPDADDIDF